MKKKFTFLLIALLACLGVKAQDVVEISTVDELKTFRDAVNSGTSYAGKTVKLTADLDLSSESNWKPIGNLVAYPGQSFKGTFDGNNHVISNVTSIDKTTVDNAVAGLFGSAENATIKNLTVKNVNVQSYHYAGGIVAYSSVEKSKGEALNIQNCKVIGGTINSTPEPKGTGYDNGDKVGGIIGLSQSGVTVDGCTVQDVTISAYRDFGGIVGASAGNVTNNTVIDVTVTQDLTNGYKNPAPDTYGDIIGRDLGATLSNNQVLTSICKIGDTKYASIADAVAAASAGDVIEIFKAGTYTLPGISKNVTIEGTVEGVEFTHTANGNENNGNISSIPNGCTFKNVAFNLGNVNYHGFQHAGTINMERCTINGRLSSYGNMNFTNCEFIQTNEDYHMWVYGGETVNYENCTFKGKGKFLNLYQNSTNEHVVNFESCYFESDKINKAAINVKASEGATKLHYTVTINNCTTNDNFPERNITDKRAILNPVVMVDDRTSDGVEYITVTQDNVQIYPLTYVAQIGETKYLTLTEAFAAAQKGETVTLLVDYDASDEPMYDNYRNLGIEQGITFDGDGHTLTVKGRGIAVKGTDSREKLDVTFQNITILNTSSGARCIDTRGNINSLVLDNVTLNTQGANGTIQPLTIGGNQADIAKITIKSSTIQTNDEGSAYYAITTFNPVDMEIIGSTIKGWACIYAKGEDSSAGSAGSAFTIENSTFVSKNKYSNSSNSFAAIMIEDNEVDVEAKKTTFNIINTGDQKQTLVGYPANKNLTSFVVLDGVENGRDLGNKVAFDNQGAGSCEFVLNPSENTELRILGGVFSDEPDQDLLYTGLVAMDNDDPVYKYKVAPGSYVAEYNGKKYVTLQAALDAAEVDDHAEIVIDLLADATLDITAWNGTKNALSIGTVNTQSITINGNNHTLNFVQKNSDWNNVATMNDAQTKLILNDMAITNSEHNNGPWNRHDINFNCAVELNNVTSDKALALKNHATLNNVTITENNTSDTYGLWISPRVENQTININGLNLTAILEGDPTGRGIKVDDQYVNKEGATAKRLTLNIANSTFNTEAKAAILLKSSAGVDVIDGGGNKIENVADDNVNLVWVDVARAEEYYKYTLTSASGSKMVPETKEEDYVAKLLDGETIRGYYKNSLQSAVDAAYLLSGDKTVELINDITGYTLIKQKEGLNLTIEGAQHTIDGQIIIDGDGRSTGTETLTIQNIAFTGNQTNFYTGSDAFILIPSTKTSGTPYYTGKYNYAHNVTISDCSFTSTSETLNVVGVKSTSGATNYNLTIQNVTGRNLHSLAQLTATEGSTITNCDVEADGFVNIDGGGRTHIISNCKFVSLTEDGYAVREKGNSTAEITLTDNDFTSFKIVQFGKKDDPKGTVTIESGKYVGDIVSQDTDKSTGKIAISGGHFSAPLGDSEYAAFIAEGKSGVNGIYLSETPEAPNGIGDAVATLKTGDKTTNYASLEAAFADAIDGSTITLLKDCAGNGIKVPEGKFHGSNGLIVDFGGHTYTVDGTTVGSAGTETQAFQLLKDNYIFFTNGTIYSEKALFLVQNYSDLTLEDMTLTLNNENYASGYTLSNNNGNIYINGSTINANPAGGFAFDVCRYSSYPSVSVTVAGESVINGDVEVSASGSDAKEGFTLTLDDGKINGNLVLDESAKAAMAATPELAIIRERDSFGQPAPEGYKWQSEGNGNSILVPANYVAQVGDKKYETFPEAATAAAGTKVILLLQDISDLYTMSVGETLRVEKAGKAFDDPAAPDNNYTVNSMIEGPVTIYSLKAAEQFAAITDGYYHIKNLGNNQYVNVKGRKDATVDATADDIRSQAGTVIKVKATNGQVEVLRSQAIDIPHYAERAMSYVPDVAKLLVEKLNATGSGEILGTTGFDAIMQKFNDSFDYHLYTEQAEGGVRIFGRTPSMKPVVEFYNEHKANVDAKLPQLESYINSAIAKVVDKVGKGNSLKESFKLHTIWERMDNNALTEPSDDDSELAFLQQVLASETNVWNFAYQTATFYMEKVEESSVFDQIPAELRSYWNLAKQVRPGFKYYIVQKDGKMDFISEGNIDIKNNAARTIWALEPATEFDVEFNVTNKDGEGFATLYTDFGYQLPEGVTALKVTGIDADDIAQTEEIGNAVAAQTPVLLKAPTAGKQTLTIGNYGAAVSGNEIHGADYLIDQYTINEPALESLFQLLAEASETTAEKYDYLQRKNSGTVNNKYFFPMTDEDVTSGETPIRTLTTDEEGTPVFAKTFTGVKANEAFMVSETIDPIYLDIPTTPDAPATIDEAYYRIKNLGNNQYVNVQGRKTATVDATEETAKTLPGTIIKVKSTVGVLDILRSQAVDVPRYAQRAMTYVPELAELIVEKLQATGSGEILGTTGFDAIMQKFNDSFDYHLHVVYADEEGDKYRIYGQIPTMKPVVEFYNEHKANVDYKLKDLETAVNGAIEKLVNKMGMGSSLINSFSLETIWQRMGSQLTKPADEASKLTFLQEVLSNEKNVWDFAYQTVTFYMEKVEKSQYFSQLPEAAQAYWNRAKNVHPGFKYYIVQKDNKMDIISQGNIDIQNDDLRTMWTLEPVETMTVNVPEENSRIVGATFDESGKRTGFEKGYYTTLYTDFAYQLPEGVVALKVTEIKDTYLGDEKLTYEKEGVTLGLGLLKTEVIGQEVPAQTPVLIMSKTADPFEITIRDDFGASADVSGNLLRGADYLIEQYEINTPALEGLFDLVKGKVSSELTDKYEHLIRKNSGTVNNKFFFSLNINDELATAYQKKTGNEMTISPVLTLSKLSGKKLAFNESWDNIQPNSVFLFSEKKMPALFTLTGDVTGKVDNVMMPDGIIDVSDVTGQVNIVQERDKKEYNYDYEAADVIYVEGTDIEVSDVTGEVNIIQKRSKHPDLP